MSDHCPDLWGVWRNLERITANTRDPKFADFWQQSLGKLEAALGAAPVVEGEGAARVRAASEVLQNHAFVYPLTGDKRQADRALELLELIRLEPCEWNFIEHNEMYPQDTADLMTAEITKSCANAVSWLWPELSEDQKRTYIGMIAERGGKAIYSGATAGCWWGNALNSNWTAVLNSGLAFAALMDVGASVSDAQDGRPGRPAPRAYGDWLAFAQARTVEMLDLAAEEGAGIEGAGYWLYCFGSLQDIVEAIHNVTGEHLYAHPFWRVCSRFLPYVALPDWSAWVNYADTGYKGMGGSYFFHGVASRIHDPFAQWYGNEILRRHGGPSWKNLVYYNPEIPEQPITQEPSSRFFKSIHMASFRSDWEDDATYMFFKGGSNAWSHTHLDLNSFFITSRGERLATEPGPEHYSLAYWHSIQPVVATSHHNCIVVDGAHQRVPAQYAMSYDLEEAGDCYSRLTDPVSTDWLEMIRGDATTAYGDQLARAWRDVVYLKPDVFVIFDDLVGHPVRCQRNFEWMLHSECELQDVDGRIEARGEKAALFIEPVFPAGWEHKYLTGRNIPYGDDKPLHAVSIRPYWHHKWNVNPEKSPYPHWDPRGDCAPLFDNDCQYLIVLSALAAGDAPQYQLEPLEAGKAKGVRLRGEHEEFVVLFNPDCETVAFGDLETDAEKLVLRVRAEGVEHAAVRGSFVKWQGEELGPGLKP